VDALLRHGPVPDVPPQAALRAELEPKTAEELHAMLAELDPVRAEDIDPYNKRRLIRAIEIVKVTGKPVPSLVKAKVKDPFDILWLGVDTSDEELKMRIEHRLKERLDRGLVAEVRRLHEHGLSWERMEELGLEYRFTALYLQNKLREAEYRRQLETAIWQYARRQRTWWRQHDDITWIMDTAEADQLVRDFLATPR
jgi:tRNA dimethylallyltransferase